MPDKNPAQVAADYFTSVGYSKPQVAGILANLEAESGFRTDAKGDGGKAYGIAQWHPDRQANLKRFADERGSAPSNYDTQLSFVHWELNNTEKSAGMRFRSQTTPGGAAATFDRYYERSAEGAKGNSGKRIKLAEKYDSQLPDGVKMPGGKVDWKDWVLSPGAALLGQDVTGATKKLNPTAEIADAITWVWGQVRGLFERAGWFIAGAVLLIVFALRASAPITSSLPIPLRG